MARLDDIRTELENMDYGSLGDAFVASDIILYLLALMGIFAPVAVVVRKGFFSRQCLVVVLLMIPLFVPAIFYALYVVYETSPVTGRQARLERLSDSEQGYRDSPAG